MSLDHPLRKRFVSGNLLDEAGGLSVGEILVECPLLEKAPTACFLRLAAFSSRVSF